MLTRRRRRLLTSTFILGSTLFSLFAVRAEDGRSAVASRAREILSRRCFACHGANGAAQKNVFVLDRKHLVESRIVLPGDVGSTLLRMIESEAMPPRGGPLAPDEKRILREWILAGAADWGDEQAGSNRTFLTEEAILSLIRRDLLADSARNRPYLRYFSLAHLYNAGVPEGELEMYCSALSKLMNSLSWHSEISRPAAIDSAKSIFRIDLRDYRWTADTWNLLLAVYPYSLHADERRVIERQSGSTVEYVRADWFAATASIPPLYHTLLGLPRFVSDLETMLGIDATRDLAEEKNIARVGLRTSGVSQNNRVLERHASPHGAYWKSFDFRASIDDQNIFKNPLSFRAAGSEIIFNLPNGLQAYFVTDSNGRRIDEAPIAIVSDRTNPDDPVIRNGRSCMSCHYDGVRNARDEIGPLIRNSSVVAFDRDKALAIYPAQDNLDRLFERDRLRFKSAVELAGAVAASNPQQEPINALARRYGSDLSLANAAAEVGLEPADFRERISRNARLMSFGYAQLLVPGGAMKRDAWDRGFLDLAVQIEVGGLDPGRALVGRSLSVAEAASPGRIAGAGRSSEAILRAARTIFVRSSTVFLKPSQLEVELRKRPEFSAMGLSVVTDPRSADLMIHLDRPLFTYTFTFSVSSVGDHVMAATGKVTAFDGNFAAPKIAKELLKKFQAVRNQSQ